MNENNERIDKKNPYSPIAVFLEDKNYFVSLCRDNNILISNAFNILLEFVRKNNLIDLSKIQSININSVEGIYDAIQVNNKRIVKEIDRITSYIKQSEKMYDVPILDAVRDIRESVISTNINQVKNLQPNEIKTSSTQSIQRNNTQAVEVKRHPDDITKIEKQQEQKKQLIAFIQKIQDNGFYSEVQGKKKFICNLTMGDFQTINSYIKQINE